MSFSGSFCPSCGPFLRVTVRFCDTYLLPGPHDLFQLLLNDNRDIFRNGAHGRRPVRPLYFPASRGGLSGVLVLCSTIDRANWLGSRGRGPRPSGFFFGGFFFLSAMCVLYHNGRRVQPTCVLRLIGQLICKVPQGFRDHFNVHWPEEVGTLELIFQYILQMLVTQVEL